MGVGGSRLRAARRVHWWPHSRGWQGLLGLPTDHQEAPVPPGGPMGPRAMDAHDSGIHGDGRWPAGSSDGADNTETMDESLQAGG